MEEIKITPASVDDAEEILDLQKIAYRSEAEIYHDWTIPPLHQTLDEIRAEFMTHVILKAVGGHRIVGSVRACMRDTTCHIGKLIVDPEYQNQGLGTRLLTEIERIHKEAVRFELFTGTKSLKNQHLYQKLGYREFKRESLSGPVELVFMEKLSSDNLHVPDRQDHEPPAAIAQRGWRYHHMGIPTDTPRPGERYIEHLKMYVEGFETSPYGIEWMRFEPGCPISELIRTVPHIAFEVDDLDAAIKGKILLGEVSSPSKGVRVAMIVDDGAPVEFLEFRRP